MAVAPFPHHYSATLAGAQLGAASRSSIAIGPPSEFGGTDDVWSPEHLLLGAVLACLKATFDAYARRASLRVDDWRGQVDGTLEKGSGGPVFTSIRLSVELETAPGDEARAKQLLETAERDCIVSRALAVPVELSTHVRTHSSAA